MKTPFAWLASILLLVVSFTLLSTAVLADDAQLKSRLVDAARQLTEQPGYRWTTETHWPARGRQGERGTTTTGQTKSDGYVYVTIASSGGQQVQFARRGEHAALLVDGNWVAAQRGAGRRGARGGQGGGDRGGTAAAVAGAAMAGTPLPVQQALDLVNESSELVEADGGIRAKLSPRAAALLGPQAGPDGRRGGRGQRGARGQRGGRQAGQRGDGAEAQGQQRVDGVVTFQLRDGALAGYTITLDQPSAAENENAGSPGSRIMTTTTTITAVETTTIDMPADAREIVDALTEGRTPNVFVPEPGFRRLFNGRDLTGWSGRSGHWTVEDGAITGRSTREHPADGNNFLIAMDGDKPLVVDDFELRFSYRIVADNDAGFANSGMQYRSKDLGKHVVAGYQADFEAGTTYSGILYDEAGGAGGRGIMAERGELVTWDADGKKRVTGRLGDSAEIQTHIKPGDWNEYVIIAQGNRLQHFINGVQTVGVIDDTVGQRLTSGILALQLHAGEPMTVQMKDARIKALGGADVEGGAAIKIAEGFQIELLYTVPRETEGSWVAMCLDPRGRLIVADQNGDLHRVTLPRASGEAVKTERITLDIGGAHGLLWAFDSLYVAVNEGGRPHGVYRLRDTDGDDTLDSVELLRQVNASGEHGLHSLVLSPDGESIYVVIGNSSSLTEMSSSRVPKNWSEDQLLPRLVTGFMDDSYAPQGYVSRMDPDGKNWELIAIGLRNEFDVAFNTAGELFTYDADMEWDIGSPWYRPTRVNHVISGADFGFRNGDAKWPEHYVDSFGAAVNIGPGSPTGIAFGYGAKFPARYQNALYLADWSFGKLRAVHLKPSGASYTGEFEDFISGQPFPVTDFIINPNDGSMLVAVGGRNTQSALYRVAYVGQESTEPSRPDDEPYRADRELRHKLEALHGGNRPGAVATAWPYLDHQDRAIRYAARIALEWQDVGEWRDRALNERNARSAIAAIVALARVTGRDRIHRGENEQPDPALRSRMLAALDAIDWASLQHADRLDLLRAYSLVMIRHDRPTDDEVARLIAKLDPLFPSRQPELDALLARLLIYLEAPSAAAKVVDAILTAPTQEEQVDLAVALRSLRTGWTPELREKYFQWFVTAEAFRGGNTFASSLRNAKNEAVELLSDDQREALRPILEARPERASPRELLAARPLVKQWELDELVPIAEQGMRGGRNFERGRALYGAVACAACHRFVNEGGSVGPELTGVVGRFTVRDLLESMTHPSKVISDQYQAVVIETTDGRTIVGRVGNLSGANVNVIEDMLEPGRMTNIRRSDIEEIRPSTVSMMPEGLLNTLTAEEIQDLVAYLLSRGDPQHAAFR